MIILILKIKINDNRSSQLIIRIEFKDNQSRYWLLNRKYLLFIRKLTEKTKSWKIKFESYGKIKIKENLAGKRKWIWKHIQLVRKKIVKLIRIKTKQEAKQLQIKVIKFCKIFILILKISFRSYIIIFQL